MVAVKGDAELLEIIQTLRSARRLARGLNRWQ
jgi:hypothetical protein